MMKFNRFSWLDTFAFDFEAAKQFYSEIFGWQFTDQFNGDELVYSLAGLSSRHNTAQIAAVAGIGPCHIPKSEGNPWNWGAYILVENLESAIARAVDAGGTICKGPMDVMEAGRMAVCADSGGAVFHLWQAMSHFGADLENVPGAHCWFELASSDTGKSAEFYSDVFGWMSEESEIEGNRYWTFRLDDAVIGGMHNRTEATRGQEIWLPYFQSIDLDPQIDKCQRLGGTVVSGPVSVPDIGRYVILSDREHSMFGIAERV